MEEETDEDECDEPENLKPGIRKYNESSKSSLISSSELCSSASSSLQFSIGDNEVEPTMAADFSETGRVIKGRVTFREVSSLVSPLDVKPRCLWGVGGDGVCMG